MNHTCILSAESSIIEARCPESFPGQKDPAQFFKADSDMTSVTNTSLLEGLRDKANQPVWTEFCSRYGPVLESFGRRLGLTEHDAQDAAQDALLAFATAYQQGKYNRAKGRLRSWLSGIAVNKIRDIQRKRIGDVLRCEGGDTRTINEIPDERSISEIWEAQWQQAIVEQCMAMVSKEVEPKTMQAFTLFAIRGLPADKVASILGRSANAVYKAKRSVLARMRKLHTYLEENW